MWSNDVHLPDHRAELRKRATEPVRLGQKRTPGKPLKRLGIISFMIVLKVDWKGQI